MNFTAMRTFLAITLLYVSSAVLAAPGTPIGVVLLNPDRESPSAAAETKRRAA